MQRMMMPSFTPGAKWLLIIHVAVFLGLFIAEQAGLPWLDDAMALYPAPWLVDDPAGSSTFNPNDPAAVAAENSSPAGAQQQQTAQPTLQIWQPFTYWLVFDSAINFLLIVLMLWFFFPAIERLIGTRRFVQAYIGIVVVSGLLNATINPQFDVAIGPYASLIGCLFILAYLRANEYVLFFFLLPIKVKWLALGFTAVLILIALSDPARAWGVVGVQVGGIILALAFCVVLFPEQNQLWGRNRNSTQNPFGGGGGSFGSFGRDSGGRSQTRERRPRSRREEPEEADISDVIDKQDWEQKRLDEILVKIKEHGIDSLTRKEKELLDRISRKGRGQQ